MRMRRENLKDASMGKNRSTLKANRHDSAKGGVSINVNGDANINVHTNSFPIHEPVTAAPFPHHISTSVNGSGSSGFPARRDDPDAKHEDGTNAWMRPTPTSFVQIMSVAPKKQKTRQTQDATSEKAVKKSSLARSLAPAEIQRAKLTAMPPTSQNSGPSTSAPTTAAVEIQTRPRMTKAGGAEKRFAMSPPDPDSRHTKASKSASHATQAGQSSLLLNGPYEPQVSFSNLSLNIANGPAARASTKKNQGDKNTVSDAGVISNKKQMFPPMEEFQNKLNRKHREPLPLKYPQATDYKLPNTQLKIEPTPELKLDIKGNIESEKKGDTFGPSFPTHNGLSPFYAIDDDMEKVKSAQYRHSKVVDRKQLNAERQNQLLKSQPSAAIAVAGGNRDTDTRDLIEQYREKVSRIKGPPITFTCNPDLPPPIDFSFEYIDCLRIGRGVEMIDPGFLASCDCPEGICDPATCSCTENIQEDGWQGIPFYQTEDGTMVLRPEFLNRRAALIQCSDTCSCHPNCWSQVVKRGRTVRLDIFQTPDRGFGLRSPDRIKAGQFIDCYHGELITAAECDARDAAIKETDKASYLFNLDYNNPADSDDENDDTESQPKRRYVVDGRKFGSVSRFLNHSCRPNLKIVPAFHHYADDAIYDTAFFAVRDIEPGTELTFDYYPMEELDRDRETGRDRRMKDPDVTKCLCGQEGCRGWLWPDLSRGVKI